MTYVKRPINGISLNGTEFLLNDVGEPMYFSGYEEAHEYLTEKGVTQAEIDTYLFVDENGSIEETEDESEPERPAMGYWESESNPER